MVEMNLLSGDLKIFFIIICYDSTLIQQIKWFNKQWSFAGEHSASLIATARIAPYYELSTKKTLPVWGFFSQIL